MLWALAIVNPASKYGTRAIRTLLKGGFAGFSTGIPYDTELFKARREVIKFGLAEVSLVAQPAYPASVLVSMHGAGSLAEWPKYEEIIREMYASLGEECKESNLDIFVANQRMWALVAAAKTQERFLNEQLG
jgi:hypothetical protein